MFERFTQKSTRVIVLAQEESRRLGHNFVGTEQILLGLLAEGTGIAASVLTSLGVTLESARTEVEKLIGRGSGNWSIEIPFTPRGKAVLETALAESRQLKHDYIRTEHLLLGIVREGERILDMGRGAQTSVAFQVLQNLGVEAQPIRIRVMQAIEVDNQDQS